MNLAENAENYTAGEHEGFEPTAWAAFQESIEVIAQKCIKVVVNAGSLNPRGLAGKVADLVCPTPPFDLFLSCEILLF